MKYILVFFCLTALVGCVEQDTGSVGRLSEAAFQPQNVHHTMLLTFRPRSYPEGVQTVVAAFEQLPTRMPEIQAIEWGTNKSNEGFDKGFTHLFRLTFKHKGARDQYLLHRARGEFIELLKPHVKNVLVLDYAKNEAQRAR